MAVFPSNLDAKKNLTRERVIDVGPEGDFPSLGPAVIHAGGLVPPPDPTNPVIIQVGPGVIVEPANPVILEPDVHIQGSGKDTTTIQAGNPLTPVIVDNSSGDKTITDLTIEGGTIGVKVTGDTNLEVKEVGIKDQTEGGIEVTGPNALVGVKDVKIEPTTSDYGVKITNGEKVTIDDTDVKVDGGATITTGILVDGGVTVQVDKTEVEVGPTGTVLTGLDLKGGAQTSLDNTKVKVDNGGLVTTGINLEGGAKAEVGKVNLIVDPSGSMTDAFVVDQAEIDVQGNIVVENADNGFNLKDSGNTVVTGNGGAQVKGPNVINAIVFENEDSFAGTFALTNASYDPKKVLGQPNGLRAINNKVDLLDDDANLYEIGQQVVVGNKEQGRGLWAGKGGPFTDQITVLTSPTGTAPFTDVTTPATEQAGTFTFPGTAAGNSILLGFKEWFEGFDIINTATTYQPGGGNIEFQYWDGGSYQPMGAGVTAYQTPQEDRGNRLGLLNEIQSTKFDTSVRGLSVTQLLDGKLRHWVRMIITNPITRAPIFRRVGLHATASRITKEGSLSFLGIARELRQDAVKLEPTGTNDPILVARNPSPNVILQDYSGYPAGLDSQASGKFSLYKGIDASSKVNVKLIWRVAGPGLGNALFQVIATPIRRVSMSGPPDLLPDTFGALTEQSVVVAAAAPGVAGGLVETDVPGGLNIAGYQAGDEVAVMVRRVGSSGLDTLLELITLEAVISETTRFK